MILLGALFVIACGNPFSTREPEPPEDNTSSFIPPTTAEIVFLNLQLAIGDKNVENYIRSFVDTTSSEKRFVFVPDQGVAARNPGVFVAWDIGDERRYFTRMLQAVPNDSTRGLNFRVSENRPGSNTATIVQSYELIVRHSQQENNIPVVVRGEARFLLERDGTGDWAIYSWEDFSNGVDPTWSDLKVSFQ